MKYKELLMASDYIIVGSPGEKLFVIGELLMLGRITPRNYKELTGTIDIIPIGFNAAAQKVSSQRTRK